MGKGLTVTRSPQRKHDPDATGWTTHANLPAGNSEQGKFGQGPPLPQSLWSANGWFPVVLLGASQQESCQRCRSGLGPKLCEGPGRQCPRPLGACEAGQLPGEVGPATSHSEGRG